MAQHQRTCDGDSCLSKEQSQVNAPQPKNALLVDCLESCRHCDPRTFRREKFIENVEGLPEFKQLRPEAVTVDPNGVGLVNTQQRYELLLREIEQHWHPRRIEGERLGGPEQGGRDT